MCALEDTRAEGARKALVQAATGVGKTYLAAFDSKNYKTGIICSTQGRDTESGRIVL